MQRTVHRQPCRYEGTIYPSLAALRRARFTHWRYLCAARQAGLIELLAPERAGETPAAHIIAAVDTIRRAAEAVELEDADRWSAVELSKRRRGLLKAMWGHWTRYGRGVGAQ